MSSQAVLTILTRVSGVVFPVNGYLPDRDAVVGGDYKQLGVEKPPIVLHQGEQGLGRAPGYGLESALGVPERGEEQYPDQGAVGAGDQLPFEGAGHPGALHETAADGDMGTLLDGLQ